MEVFTPLYALGLIVLIALAIALLSIPLAIWVIVKRLDTANYKIDDMNRNLDSIIKTMEWEIYATDKHAHKEFIERKKEKTELGGLH